METLRNYLNAMSIGMQREFAVNCGTSVEYLRKAISKKQKLGPALSVLIEINSKGVVDRKELHPDDWGKIWPELQAA
ncbi:Cro/Cl family transcriptional regulator [Serratia liquefaciens]|uniref:Cro/Cl family transcriptional regulator n=1 Tax=Serratia liquefaciens TaxID=614 RepID=UPI000D50E923|nr:Cro/Cl family transcriptional regulator [Serratia liquefaciens]PVD44558.1 Cro/Cl family transcriptional regulator [Serratia liquefaciens]QHT50812.1 helix-turn-helix domain-containing protein [Serratia liquefaciens]